MYLDYLPTNSRDQVQSWIQQLGITVIIKKKRRTKFGDFRLIKGKMFITINNNLNVYSFLITLVHEIAHAFTYAEYGTSVKPHGKEWQLVFKKMLLSFLSPRYFPNEILEPLSKYAKKPKAATFSDTELSLALRSFDEIKTPTLLELNEGAFFQLENGKVFTKGKLIRTRFMCVERDTKKEYLFHPLAVIKVL